MSANEQREAFDALVRQHEMFCPTKLRVLMDFRDSIAEARKKGASFETIRIYLRKTAINVSADTVARFCREVLAETGGRRSQRKRKPRQPRQNGVSAAEALNQSRSAPAPWPVTRRPPARASWIPKTSDL